MQTTVSNGTLTQGGLGKPHAVRFLLDEVYEFMFCHEQTMDFCPSRVNGLLSTL